MKTLDTQPQVNAADRRLLADVKALVRSRLPDAEVILYGSTARGERTPDSDYDVLVLTDRCISTAEETAMIEAIYEYELAHDVVISISYHSRLDWAAPIRKVTPFYCNVETEGVWV